MTVKHECSGKIWGAYRDVSGRAYKCSRPATVKYDGKWYCWQHDPNRVAAEAEKRHAIEKAKMDRKAARYACIARNARLAALVTPELMALLDGLIALAESTDIQVPALLRGPMLRTIDEAHALATRIREALEEGTECID